MKKNRYKSLEGVSQLSAFLAAYGVQVRSIKSTDELIRIASVIYEIPELSSVQQMSEVVATMTRAQRRDLARKNLHLVGAQFSRQRERRDGPSPLVILHRAAEKVGIKQNSREKLKAFAWRVALLHDIDPALIGGDVNEIAAQIQTTRRNKNRSEFREEKLERPSPKRDRAPRQSRVIRHDDPRLKDFYNSPEWKRLSYDVKLERGRRCECCGTTPDHGIRIITDHIRPIRKHWELRLTRSNLQILCEECNSGKGSRDETDFRAVAN